MDKPLVSTRLDARTHDALRDLAERRDRTVAYLVRKAVEQFVEEQQKQSRRPAA